MSTPVGRNRLCIIGNYACGKTSLKTRLQGKPFLPVHRPTLATTSAMYLPVKGSKSGEGQKVLVDDTSGEERFALSLTGNFARHAQCLLLCFDLSSRSSFLSAQRIWLPWARSEASSAATYILVGLKADLLHRPLSSRTIRKWADQQGMDYFETSAKTGTGVDVLARRIGSFFTDRQQLCLSMSMEMNSVTLRQRPDVKDSQQQTKKCSC